MKGIFALAALFVATAVAAQNAPPAAQQAGAVPQQAGLSQIEKAASSRNVCDNSHGGVVTVFESVNINFTPTVLKAVVKQFPLAFMIPTTQLEDKAVIEKTKLAFSYNLHDFGVYFDTAALGALTPDIVNTLLATAEQQYFKAFNLKLQYVMFSHKTPDYILDITRARQLRPVLYNVDFSDASSDHISKLEQTLIDPSTQSYIGLLNASNSGQTQVLLDIYNSIELTGFKPVRLSECLLPLRKATDSEPVNPNVQPQPIVAGPENMAAFFSVNSGLATALLAVVALIVV